MTKDLLKIINHYGVSNQLKKLSEEVFEFQETVLNYENARKSKEVQDYDKLQSHIEEELGDVLVLLTQFIGYYGIKLEDGNVLKIMNEKIARQLKRIEAENDNN